MAVSRVAVPAVAVTCPGRVAGALLVALRRLMTARRGTGRRGSCGHRARLTCRLASRSGVVLVSAVIAVRAVESRDLRDFRSH